MICPARSLVGKAGGEEVVASYTGSQSVLGRLWPEPLRTVQRLIQSLQMNKQDPEEKIVGMI